jgi:hypothetical protein
MRLALGLAAARCWRSQEKVAKRSKCSPHWIARFHRVRRTSAKWPKWAVSTVSRFTADVPCRITIGSKGRPRFARPPLNRSVGRHEALHCSPRRIALRRLAKGLRLHRARETLPRISPSASARARLAFYRNIVKNDLCHFVALQDGVGPDVPQAQLLRSKVIYSSGCGTQCV